MSSKSSGANDLLVEHCARPIESCETTNGNRSSTKTTLEKACNHKSKDTDKDGRYKSNRKSIPKHGFPRDTSKKSLSFFPSVEYSEESSEASDEADGSEANNNSSSEHQNSLNEPGSIKDNAALGGKAPVVLQSDHDDASSTSSCSCEDHSSVASQDPHGDLDYDDDDSMKGSLNGRREQPPPNNEGESDFKGSSLIETSTNDLQEQHKTASSTNDKDNNKLVIEHARERSNDDGHQCGGTQKSTKIRSFINFDHGHGDIHDDNNRDIILDTKKSSKDRSHKSHEALLKYFFKDACYFQIKSINRENVALSKSMGVWSTPVQNEFRLNAAFREHRNVILIFSVQQSGAFQGFARMVSESGPPDEPVPWVLPERLSSATLGGVFRVEWLCTKELNFNETRHLYNSFNNNKPVKVARDGQQVEPKIGRKLCMLFPKDSKKRLLACVETLKIQSRQRKQLLRKSSYYPLDDARLRAGVRRTRNGPYSRLDSGGIINGFAEANSTTSHDAYHLYSQPGPYVGGSREPNGPIRRGGGGGSNNQIVPGHFSRPRPFPIHTANAYQRPSHYGYHMPVLGPAPPGVHEEFYPSHYGPNNHPYLDPMQHASVEQHSRPYNDWTMSGMDPHPSRYHPYPRPKR
uniref:YTH domain-containing protein 1 n=1 Tax=Aceria tosichella TaxID=561515 RepID=A0A6G1SM88_9ACAR